MVIMYFSCTYGVFTLKTGTSAAHARPGDCTAESAGTMQSSVDLIDDE
jgi:hypothetical protein